MPSLSGILVNHTTFQIMMGADKANLADVTALFPPMQLVNIHYIDPISFEADTIHLVFSDVKDQIIQNKNVKKGIWLKVIIHQWNKDYIGSHTKRDLGTFMIDQLKQSGPPTQTTILASSVPISSQIKLTLKNLTRFTTTIAGLAQDVATENGLELNVKDAGVRVNRPLSQAEQWNESDLSMLSRYCKNNGLAVKIVNNTLVVFDEQVYEQKPSVYTIDFSKPGAGIEMTNWELTTQSQDIYALSTLAYYDSATDTVVAGKAEAPEPSGSGEAMNSYDYPFLTADASGEDISAGV
jgi:uncharacterized protein